MEMRNGNHQQKKGQDRNGEQREGAKDTTTTSSAAAMRPRMMQSHTVGGGLYNRSLRRACSNPLDRLCSLLLDWNLAGELSKGGEQTSEESAVLADEKLPACFSCFDEYIRRWEPLIVAEMKESLVSSFKTRPPQAIKRGYLQFSIEDTLPAATQEIQCLVSPHKDNGGDTNSVPSAMDVILISPDKLSFPLQPGSDSNAIVGLVLHVSHSSGSKFLHIKMHSKHWLRIRDKARVIPSSSTDRSNPHSKRPAPPSAPKPSGLTTYRMYYTIVDSSRSSWREFQAAHELGTNIPLVRDILASERELEMPPTPPLSDQEDVEEEVYSLPSDGPDAGIVRGKKRSPADRCEASVQETKPDPAVKRMAVLSQHDAQREHALRQAGFSSTFAAYLQRDFNASQFRAITTAATSKGFTLIQGPPGTGKTTTIIALLNALHIREFNKYYDNLLEMFLGPIGMQCRLRGDEQYWLQVLAKHAKSKPRILVVAPSNVAVDNIILRIMEKGFQDSSMQRYNPNMVRVGVGKSVKVESVGLEELVDKELLPSMALDQKKARLLELTTTMAAVLKDVLALQTLLMNMKTAFEQCCPLPSGWELRIASDTALPYWVDHNAKTTSTHPPVVPPQGSEAGSGGYASVRSLPEYTILSRRFAKALSSLETMQLTRSRLQVVLDALSMRKRDSIPIATREMIEASIIDEAQLLFTTTNSCGHPSLESTEFCLTVVDEAAQCVEPSTLIALRRGCRQCVMVGDQNQLPATVFSESVRRLGYDRSLFERLIDCGYPYIMLDTQYRMCPEISEFPSRMFYRGMLLDGKNVEAADYLPAYIQSFIPREAGQARLSSSGDGVQRDSPEGLPPLAFFDLEYSEDQRGRNSSRMNRHEAQFCLSLLIYLCGVLYRHGSAQASIGVITPYTEQLAELQDLYKQAHSRLRREAAAITGLGVHSPVLNVEFNTVDGFQGKEKDIILISAVRSNEQQSVGFLSDKRRMNVAITRAKYALVVVGNSRTLFNDPNWKALITHTKFRHCFYPVRREGLSIPQALGRESQPTVRSAYSSVAQGGAPSMQRNAREEELEEGEVE